MNPGDRIIVLKGAVVFFPLSEKCEHIMTFTRDMIGRILTVYPNGSPNKIEFGRQVTVMASFDWVEGKDYREVRE